MDLQLQLEMGNQKPEVSLIQRLPWEIGVGGGLSGKCVELRAREVSLRGESKLVHPVSVQEPGAVHPSSLLWWGVQG